jgi:hypothetical protein
MTAPAIFVRTSSSAKGVPDVVGAAAGGGTVGAFASGAAGVVGVFAIAAGGEPLCAQAFVSTIAKTLSSVPTLIEQSQLVGRSGLGHDDRLQRK